MFWLSRCGREAISEYLQPASPAVGLRPAAVNAIQTFGDFLGYNPHCHMRVAHDAFHENGAFTVAPAPDGKQIAELFRHKVLKMLLAKGRITPERITLMDNWWPGPAHGAGCKPSHVRTGASSPSKPTEAVYTPCRRSGRWRTRARG